MKNILFCVAVLAASTLPSFGASLRGPLFDPVTWRLSPTNFGFLRSTNIEAPGGINATTGKFVGPITGAVLTVASATVAAGSSASNAFVCGIVFASTRNFTNLNAVPGTLTNLGSVSIPGNALTNAGDKLIATWGGRDAGALVNTNNFKIVYGSQTILDTGLQVSSNFVFRATLELVRTGNTAQHAEARFEWFPNGGVTGLPWASTNVNVELVQTNGINTVLALQGSAQRVGAHTNNAFQVEFQPSPR